MTKPTKRATSLTDWLGVTATPNWNVARPLGPLLSVTILILFILAVVAAGTLLFRTIFSQSETPLSTGALIAALLGAPFLIWGTVLKHQSVMFQKEGHMTDRINKAVEQLGMEKTVERIGRPVTIWTGDCERVSYPFESLEISNDKPRTKVGTKVWRESFNHETEEIDEGFFATVSSWTDEQTIIQWQGESINLANGEVIGIEGSWQAFKETLPNIEVRIGAILSLERIAQDSARHDHGRDHVRVMEILCAYIRENSPAAGAEFGNYPANASKNSIKARVANDPHAWIYNLPRLRSDIQLALSVIGRRSPEQIELERLHRDRNQAGYALDLSNTNLRKADMDGFDFENAIFFQSLLEGANCLGTNFSNCNFNYAKLTLLHGAKSDFTGAKLNSADLSYASLPDSKLVGCELSFTYFIKSNLSHSSLCFPVRKEREINRAFFISVNMKFAKVSGDLCGVNFSLTGGHPERDIHRVAGVQFRNAKLRSTVDEAEPDHSFAIFPSELIHATFGDGSVILPDGVEAKHWPVQSLSDEHFLQAYLHWLRQDMFTHS